MKNIDLHVHTTISDGNSTPEEVVKLALANDCHEIAITDHDVITDFTSLEEKYDIIIIPGIEFNTGVTNLHLLGYGIKNIDLIRQKMLVLRTKNEKVCYQVIELMEQSGYDISVEKVKSYVETLNQDSSILDKRKIVKYLIHKSYAKNTLDAYNSLIGKKQKFYVPNYKIEPKTIIELVSSSGGLTVLAHPGTLSLGKNELYEFVEELASYGLAGIEIYNSKMLVDNNPYDEIANHFGLLRTIGSDFHDASTDTLGITIDDDMYQEINKKLIRKKK